MRGSHKYDLRFSIRSSSIHNTRVRNNITHHLFSSRLVFWGITTSILIPCATYSFLLPIPKLDISSNKTRPLWHLQHSLFRPPTKNLLVQYVQSKKEQMCILILDIDPSVTHLKSLPDGSQVPSILATSAENLS